MEVEMLDKLGDKHIGKAKKFIEVLQKDASGEKRNQEMLEKAAEVGYKIIVCLTEEFKDPILLMGRYRCLLFALSKQNPMLREQLLIGDIEPEAFIVMEEKDLADEDLKKKRSE
jgi:hypothetical protein